MCDGKVCVVSAVKKKAKSVVQGGSGNDFLADCSKVYSARQSSAVNSSFQSYRKLKVTERLMHQEKTSRMLITGLLQSRHCSWRSCCTVICSAVTYGMVSANMYYYTRVMSQLFLDSPLSAEDSSTFRHLSTMEDFWKVTQGQMCI